MHANKFLSSILPPMLVFFDSMPTIKCVSEPNDLRNATFCHRVTKTNITESTSQWLADIIQFPSPPSISFFFVVQIFVFQTVYDCHLRISTGEKIKNYRGPTGFHPVTRRLGRPASRPPMSRFLCFSYDKISSGHCFTRGVFPRACYYALEQFDLIFCNSAGAANGDDRSKSTETPAFPGNLSFSRRYRCAGPPKR